MISHIEKRRTNEKYSIGLDLDGTSGGFHKAFRDTLIGHQGFADHEIPVRTPNEYCYVSAGIFPDKDTFMSHLHRATGNGVYRNLSPYSGLRKHLNAMIQDGAFISVITSRPDDAMEDTLAWLTEVARVPFHEVNITHDKLTIDADVYIDDMPGHIERFQTANSGAIVYDQPYNRNVNAPRAKTWNEIPSLVRAITA